MFLHNTAGGVQIGNYRMAKQISILSLYLIVVLSFCGCAIQKKSSEPLNLSQHFTSGWVRHKSDNTSVIVFVHGVLGNAYDTWHNTSSDSYWPKLITEDSFYSSFNVYT